MTHRGSFHHRMDARDASLCPSVCPFVRSFIRLLDGVWHVQHRQWITGQIAGQTCSNITYLSLGRESSHYQLPRSDATWKRQNQLTPGLLTVGFPGDVTWPDDVVSWYSARFCRLHIMRAANYSRRNILVNFSDFYERYFNRTPR